MNDFIQSNLTEAKNVYITGHSLGGALASLTALMVSQLGCIHCVTFGSPRVGDVEFANLFNACVADIDSEKHFSCRFTTEDDPVPEGLHSVMTHNL